MKFKPSPTALTVLGFAALLSMAAFPALASSPHKLYRVLERNVSATQYAAKKSQYESRCQAGCDGFKRFPNGAVRANCQRARTYRDQNQNIYCTQSFPSMDEINKAQFQQRWRDNNWSHFLIADWTSMPGKGTGDYRRTKGLIYEDNPMICAEACLKDAKCKAVEFSKRRCYFKTSEDMGRLRHDGAHRIKNGRYTHTTRTIVKGTLSDLQRYKNLAQYKMDSTDLPGQDLRKINGTSWDGCKLACAKDRRCKAITYRSESRTCWMKKGVPTERGKAGLRSSRVMKKSSGGSRA